MITVLIPVFNEEEAITDTLTLVHRTFSAMGEQFEILVINDGSTDNTAEILAKVSYPELTVINKKHNRGYGAAMKTGIRAAKGELIAITDADGTYPIADFPLLLSEMKKHNADMVVGARTKKGAKIPLIRKPAKAIVALLANALTGMRIPDNNSGMRIFTKTLAEKFMHLYPQGFSFTLTITLAALTSEYAVEFVPIDYHKRRGSSSMSAGFNGVRNFLTFLGLIIRIVTYFRPLKFFMWPASIMMVGGLGYIIRTLIVDRNISDAGMLILLTGLQIGLFGLLAEVVVRQGQRVK